MDTNCSEIIIELSKDLYNFRNISSLFISETPVFSGTLQSVKNWLDYIIHNHKYVLESYGVDIKQLMAVYGLIKPIELLSYQYDGVFLEKTIHEDQKLSLGCLFIVFSNELSKININHPDLPYIKNVIVEIEQEIFRFPIQSKDSYLKNKLENIKFIFSQFEIQQVSLELLGLRALLYDIKKLKELNCVFLNKILKRLLNCPDSQYYGIRYEILIARSLFEKKITFKMPDPPDFLITDKEFKNVKMECTSKHFTVIKKQEDAIKGIFTAIDKKDNPKFNFDNNTVLAMDITNLGNLNERLFSDEHSENVALISEKINSTRFGSIILSNWILDEPNHAYVNIYNRIDSININIELKSFLDKFWPNNTRIKTSPYFRVPKVG